jgi:hypothetical protein
MKIGGFWSILAKIKGLGKECSPYVVIAKAINVYNSIYHDV